MTSDSSPYDAHVKYDALAITAMAVLSWLLYKVLGVSFDASTLTHYMQFIDPDLLANRLAESLFFYHANPPMLNLFTGLVLKISAENPVPLFALTFHLFGLLFAFTFFGLALRLGESRQLAYAMTALLVFSPAFVLYENWLMYTFPAVSLLCASTFALYRFIETRSTRWAVALFSLLALIALTRSLFHIAWMIVVIGGVLLLTRKHAKQILLAAAVPLLAVFLWYGKNLMLFNTFSASTWMGLGLSNITSLMVEKEKLIPLVQDGTLSKFAVISRYDEKSQLITSGDLSETSFYVPVLHDARKSTGAWNFNHINLIDVNHAYTKDALQIVRHFPGNYIQGVLLSNRLFFSPTGMNYYFTTENRIAAATLDRFYNPLLYGASLLPKLMPQPSYGFDNEHTLEVNTGTLAVGLTVAVFFYGLFLLLQVYRGKRNASPAEIAVVTFLLFNMAYIYSLGTMLELAENYRYRFIQEPLVYLLACLMIRDAVKQYRASKSG